jgi:Tfp pilus assembly protein PilO
MGPRERLILSVVIAVVVVIAMWVLLVAPERSKANNLQTQITAEQADLASAQQQSAAAQQARAGYGAEVRSLVRLNTAVPTSDQLPQLIHLINSEEVSHRVDYSLSGFGTSATDNFPSTTLNFSFKGNYVDLQNFLGAFDNLTLTNGSSVLVHGRLVTVNSIGLSPVGTKVAAAVTMTTYEAPTAASLGVTGVTGVTAVTGATGATTAGAA